MIIYNNKLINKMLSYDCVSRIMNEYDSLFSVYELSIDVKLKTQIDSLFKIDQIYTKKVNDGFWLFRHTIFGLQWVRNNKKNFLSINEIINKYGLPEYYNDSATYNYFKNNGIYLRQWKAYFMLLHYFSTKRKVDSNYKKLLYENLKSGI